ncbi:hypothetical protein [Actinomadura nitritigenes]|uniref:hypothetical protein n=1 Tax=Actinomadura nitritigenes TaxID=134602 RepID=UPI003D8AC8F5
MTAMPIEDNLRHWWLTPAASWNRLHAVPGDELRANELTLTARCGVTAVMAWPGLFSRLALPRCANCCKVLQIPRGNGTPCNEASRAARRAARAGS